MHLLDRLGSVRQSRGFSKLQHETFYRIGPQWTPADLQHLLDRSLDLFYKTFTVVFYFNTQQQ